MLALQALILHVLQSILSVYFSFYVVEKYSEQIPFSYFPLPCKILLFDTSEILLKQ